MMKELNKIIIKSITMKEIFTLCTLKIEKRFTYTGPQEQSI